MPLTVVEDAVLADGNILRIAHGDSSDDGHRQSARAIRTLAEDEVHAARRRLRSHRPCVLHAHAEIAGALVDIQPSCLEDGLSAGRIEIRERHEVAEEGEEVTRQMQQFIHEFDALALVVERHIRVFHVLLCAVVGISLQPCAHCLPRFGRDVSVEGRLHSVPLCRPSGIDDGIEGQNARLAYARQGAGSYFRRALREVVAADAFYLLRLHIELLAALGRELCQTSAQEEVAHLGIERGIGCCHCLRLCAEGGLHCFQCRALCLQRSQLFGLGALQADAAVCQRNAVGIRLASGGQESAGSLQQLSPFIGRGVKRIEAHLVRARHEEIHILQHSDEPFRCRNDFADMYVSVVIRVNVGKRLLIELQTFDGAREHRPHLFVQLCQMGNVAARSNFDAGHSAHVGVVPIV